MHRTLDGLIADFREAQDIGVHTLVHVLRIPQPSSGIDWVRYCCEHELYKVSEINGVGFYAHGFGVELKIDHLTIDFDWGPNGEPDGFDGWRLWVFTLANIPNFQSSHAELNQWLESSHQAGELIKLDNLYFDPNRRARHQRV